MAPVRAVTLLKGLISSTWVPWAPRRGSGPRLRLCNRAAPSGESCRQARRPPVLGGLCRCVPGCPGRDPVVDRVPPRSRVTRVTTGSRSAPVPSTCQSTATSPAMQATPAASGRSSAQPYPTARLPCSALCSIAPPSRVARRGIEFMVALQPALHQASSTLSELHCIALFITTAPKEGDASASVWTASVVYSSSLASRRRLPSAAKSGTLFGGRR